MEFTGCVLGDGEVHLIEAVNRNNSPMMKISAIILIISMLSLLFSIYRMVKNRDICEVSSVLIFTLIAAVMIPNVTYPNSSENRQYEEVDLKNTESVLITHRNHVSKHHVITIPHLFTESFVLETEGMNYGDIIKIQTNDGLEYNIMITKGA